MVGTAVLDIKAQLAAELKNLDKTVAPPSGHRISLKGKMFTFPDGKTSAGPINAVVLDWRNVNTYYEGAYNPGKVVAPSCFALSKEIPGLSPSTECANPQSKECEGCSFNEWGSAPGGGRGKACKNTVRIAIVPPDADAKTPVYTIDLAPSSVTAFNNMVSVMKEQMGVLPLQAQISLDFDANESYPKVTFADPEELPEALIPLMFELRGAAQGHLEKLPGS
jgi:hypothetical protein